MRPLLLCLARVGLALSAGLAWALAYPRDGQVADHLLVVSVAVWLGLLLASRGFWRARATFVALVSVVSGLVAYLWSGLAWQYGLWAPELPPVLHHLFATDGESSYNASNAQRFLLLVAVLACGGLLSRRVRVILGLGSAPSGT